MGTSDSSRISVFAEKGGEEKVILSRTGVHRLVVTEISITKSTLIFEHRNDAWIYEYDTRIYGQGQPEYTVCVNDENCLYEA